MPAAVSSEDRNRIVFYAALGYTQGEVSDEIGVSRNTVRKYLREARTAVESSSNSKRTLAAIVTNEYEWEDTSRNLVSFGDHPA